MITLQRLNELLTFDPETGIFKWKKYRAGVRPSLIAGNRLKNPKCRIIYIKIEIDGKVYNAHHLAWFITKGVWPEGKLDHIDRNGENNRPDNLRPATSGQNAINMDLRSNNQSGYSGVRYYNRKWVADIGHNGKVIYLGSFAKISEAIEVRRAKAKELFGEFACE